MALVIDASAMVIALLGTSGEAAALRGRLGAEVCHAPHLIDAEVATCYAGTCCEVTSRPPTLRRCCIQRAARRSSPSDDRSAGHGGVGAAPERELL
jgi:hypothetical protein